MKTRLVFAIGVAAVFFGACFVFFAMQDTVPEDVSTESMLGQNFVVGIPGTTLSHDTRVFLAHVRPAGIVLYYRNYESAEQFRGLIADLQEFARDTTGMEYFIMVDEEPGGASRLELFQNVFAQGAPNWGHIESDIQAMADIGVNVNLAPIADFPFEPESFIRDRVPMDSVESLIEFNQRFIFEQEQYSVASTLKHFPGLGIFITDPHKALPQDVMGESVLLQSLEIFESGIDAGADFVMTSHAIYDDLDPGRPATLSSVIVRDMLRGDLGFNGLIVTDDLTDMPIVLDMDIDRTRAAHDAIEAGHTLVMFSHSPQKTVLAFDALAARLAQEESFRRAVEENYARVAGYKQRAWGVVDE